MMDNDVTTTTDKEEPIQWATSRRTDPGDRPPVGDVDPDVTVVRSQTTCLALPGQAR
jgi:hypothetical protein